MEDVTGFVGRARETDAALEAIRKGANVLVIGRPGIGKSAFLRRLRGQLAGEARACFWIPVGNTKTVFMELARQVHETYGLSMPANALPVRHAARAVRQGGLGWRELSRTLYRMPTEDLLRYTLDTLQAKGARPLVFLDSLEMPPSQAAMFAALLDIAQVVAGMSEINTRVRIQRVLWHFQERIELKPLPLEDCAAIAEAWLAENPMRFSDEATRRRFVRHVAQDSGGVPAAVRGMLEAAGQEQEITPAKARTFQHAAGIRYMDMTPAVVLLLVVFIAMRYVSRGMGEVEMLVLSGVATALFMGLRFFLSVMRAK